MSSGSSRVACPLVVTSLAFTEGDEPALELRGQLLDVTGHATSPSASSSTSDLARASLLLVGHRLELSAPVELSHPDELGRPDDSDDSDEPNDSPATWHARIPLLASRWGGPRLPAPSGRYRLELRVPNEANDKAGQHDSGQHDSRQGASLPAASRSTTSSPDAAGIRSALPPARLFTGLFAIEAAVDADGGVSLEISPPLTEDERGVAEQARLEAAYRSSPAPLENAVFFESFYGQNASCNPLAIDRRFAIVRPDVTRYWSVADASVVVPEGSIAVIDGSAEWWRIRASARLFVVNDWLRKRYKPRPGQKVLQTWHGTPLKRIALTRPGIRPRAAVATIRERARWSFLLAQNPYSAKIFRTAYAFLGRPWQEGYPRNDVLATGDPQALRARLGIPADATVVLYAPTWRDDAPNDVDQLDVAAFSRELGPGYVTLIRGHSRSLRGGSDLHAHNVIDVTSYPDASELFLVADALVTDYSSVMFDFSVTGKPMYFFTPDLDRYRDQIRGFYFDLLAVSPGPVVHSAADLIAHLRDPGTTSDSYAERYRQWQDRFNPRDDGRASARVVDRLLATGIFGFGPGTQSPR